jgi:epothilone synthetase B
VGDPRGDKRLVAYVVLDRSTQEKVPSVGDLHGGQDQPLEAEIEVFDPIERMKFKLAYPALRHEGGNGASIELVQPERGEDWMRRYVARRSYRKFEPQTVSFEQFSQLLSHLSVAELDGVPLSKRQYASAGGLYPVQAYVYVKPGRVEGIDGGTYYYHPKQHRLVSLSREASIDSSLYPPGNRNIFEMSAFAIFLVGQLRAITPMYGEWARDFCMLEAGIMSQLLEVSAPAHQMGLCQIGAFDFDPVRHWFALEDSHVYLHSLLGGQIVSNQTELQALVADSDDIRMVVEIALQQLEKGETVAGNITPPAFPLRTQGVQSDEILQRDLRSFLMKKLPEYMIPSTIVLMEALPLTANGKVDRKALLARGVQLEPEAVYVAPQTELEQVIANIWREILQVEKIGIHDSFFDLGGNSVHLIQAHRKLQEVINPDLPIVKLFEYPTIDSLIKYVNQEQVDHFTPQEIHDQASARKRSRRQRRKR